MQRARIPHPFYLVGIDRDSVSRRRSNEKRDSGDVRGRGARIRVSGGLHVETGGRRGRTDSDVARPYAHRIHVVGIHVEQSVARPIETGIRIPYRELDRRRGRSDAEVARAGEI